MAALRADVERFSAEQAQAWYRYHSGQAEDLDLGTLCGRYPHLCHRRRVEEAQAALAAAGPAERRRARHFLQFFLQAHASSRLHEPLAAFLRARRSLQVAWDGRWLPYTAAQLRLGAEPDRERRRELSRILEQATERRLNPLAAELLAARRALARELGYPSLAALWGQAQDLDLGGLAGLAARILDATAAPARAALAADLDRYLGLDLAEAETHDYTFLARARPFDPHFPAAGLLPALRQALAGLGLDLAAMPNIRFDLAPRENKSPRAFCSAIRIPQEVVVSLLPGGGHGDYQALFHEAGHALHFGSMAAELPCEFRRLGDRTLAEAHAFLLQDLLLDPAWVAAHLPMPGPVRAAYRRLALRQKLLLVRRYCGKLRYELALYGPEPPPDAALAYARELQAATFLPYRPADHLMDLDPGLYAAIYLRAWIAAAQLRRWLLAQFGRRWWAQPRAGACLTRLWAGGTRRDAVELVRSLGCAGLDPGPLLAEFAVGLGGEAPD